MPHFDFFLELPVELTCGIVGWWLGVEEILHLDTAFCKLTSRRTLLECIFRSPLCVIDDSIINCESIGWFSARGIRACCLYISHCDEVALTTYLHEFGQYIEWIHVSGLDGITKNTWTYDLIQSSCKNLAWLECSDSCVCEPLLNLLNSLEHMERFAIEDIGDSYAEPLPPERINSKPTHRLSVTNVCLNCDKAQSEQSILRIIKPQSVRLLALCDTEGVPNWEEFVYLHSIKIYGEEPTPLLSVFERCPWIMNIDLGSTEIVDTDLIASVAVVRHLRSFHIKWQPVSDDVLLTVVKYQSKTLQQLYIHSCNNLTSGAINKCLESCPALHTISMPFLFTLGPRRMKHIHTCIVELRDSNCTTWSMLPQYFTDLECLHVIFPRHETLPLPNVVTLAQGLPLLTNIYIYIPFPREEWDSACETLGRQLTNIEIERGEKWFDFELNTL